MIVTVTPNPSVDRTLEIPALRRGAVVRVTATSAEAGGKGINVARCLTTMDSPAIALAPLSPAGEATLRELLGDAARLLTAPVAGDLRTNVSLVEPDGTVTKVNEPGPAFTADAADRLLDALVDAILAAHEAGSVAWVAVCGSLPPGLPDDFHARLAARMPTSIRVAIDADRGALRAAVGGRAALLKPNRTELEELVGRPLPSLGDVRAAAAELLGRGGLEQVLVSLGPDGALVVTADTACHVEAPIDDVANTVGAGDALLAGYLAGGATPAALPEAVAWSVAACRAPGTQMPAVSARDRSAVEVRGEPDPSRLLRG